MRFRRRCLGAVRAGALARRDTRDQPAVEGACGQQLRGRVIADPSCHCHGACTMHAPCMHHACKMLTCLRVCTRIHARVCVAVCACVCANQDGPIDKTPLFETLEHLTSKSEQVAACCQLASRSGSHLGLPLSVSLRTLHVHACTQLALQRRLSDAGRADVAA